MAHSSAIVLPYIQDRQTLNYLTGQAEHLDTVVSSDYRPEIIYPQLLQVDTSLDEFAQSVRYFASHEEGLAKWMNLNADDVPMATTSRNTALVPIHSAGIGYGYGWEEIQVAARMGVNLAADNAIAARRAADEMCQRVAFLGDASKGFEGLFNSSSVAAVQAPVGDWANPNTAVDTIIQEFNLMLSTVRQNTLLTARADTVLLPESVITAWAGRRVGQADSLTTLLEFIKRTNVYTASTGRELDMRGLLELETASATGGKRAIAYRNDPSVVKMYMPMPHRFLGLYQAGPLRVEVPGVMRLGGVNVRRPNEITYWDDV